MMEYNIPEVAQRIRGLREILGISAEDMAKTVGISLKDYLANEAGETDFSFTFLYNCSKKFGVDVMTIITGEEPKLRFYSIVRKGEGLPINRRKGFRYEHLGACFKDKIAEPFLVTAPYREEEQNQEIKLSYHKGQEFDYIISGRLKVALEDHTESLEPGDAIYYNSGHGHGMIATGGEDCVFIAVVMQEENHENGGLL